MNLSLNLSKFNSLTIKKKCAEAAFLYRNYSQIFPTRRVIYEYKAIKISFICCSAAFAGESYSDDGGSGGPIGGSGGPIGGSGGPIGGSGGPIGGSGGPVASWLSELSHVHESECTIMLQSKPVRRRDGETAEREAANGGPAGCGGGGSEELRERIRAVQERAHTVSSVFSTLCRYF
jgi:hypothetical protein